MTSTLPRLRLALCCSLLVALATFGAPGVAAERYTGLIVDARGLTVERSMAPTVSSVTGTKLFPICDEEHPLDVDFMLSEGLAIYTSSIEEAWRIKRIGGMPLVVKAVALEDGELVLDEASSRALLSADHESGFLEKYAVAIVN